MQGVPASHPLNVTLRRKDDARRGGITHADAERPSGSEGGGGSIPLPTPILAFVGEVRACAGDSRSSGEMRACWGSRSSCEMRERWVKRARLEWKPRAGSNVRLEWKPRAGVTRALGNSRAGWNPRSARVARFGRGRVGGAHCMLVAYNEERERESVCVARVVRFGRVRVGSIIVCY